MLLTDGHPLANLFNQFGEQESSYPFALKVLVARDITPRDARFTYFKEMGYNTLVELFDTGKFSSEEDILTFYFPENHLSVHESRLLVSCLTKAVNERGCKVTEVHIVTKDPLIVGNCGEGQCMVLSEDGSHRANLKEHFNYEY